jgi:tetratricopeptide (TPR) repeat protein
MSCIHQSTTKHGKPNMLFFLLLIILILHNQSAYNQSLNKDSLWHIMQTANDWKARLGAARKFLNIQFNKQQYDSVAYYCKTFLPLAEKYKHQELICSIHFYRGCSYIYKGRIDSALMELRKGERLAYIANDTTIRIQTLKMFGNLYYSQGNIDALNELYQESKRIGIHKDGPSLLEQASYYLGLAFINTNQVDSGTYYLRQAVAMANKLSNKEYYYQAIYGLANVLILDHKFEEAERLINEAIVHFKALKMTKAIAASETTVGLILFHKKEYKAAIRSYHKALEYGEQNRDYNILGDVYPKIADAFSKTGNWAQAFQYMDLAYKLSDSVKRDKNKMAIGDIKLQYEKTLRDKENEVLSLQLANRKATISRQRWIFGGIIALLLFGAAAVWFYLHIRKRRMRQEAELKQSETELKSLKSQLDPHFIHNFFSFLTKQVRGGEADHTVNMLEECSRYFRNILEQNRKNIISLEEEMEGLARYLHIQQTICNGTFEYTIHADDNVDVFGIELPAFIFQPFIENSLKHGLVNIDYPGKIDVHFSATDDYLEAIITDNGKTENTSQDMVSNHKSLGIQLTHERLHLFTKMKHRKQGLIETGWKAAENGYFVSVKIPLN